MATTRLSRNRFLAACMGAIIAPRLLLERASGPPTAAAADVSPATLPTVHRITSMRFSGAGARWLEVGDIMRFPETGEAVRLLRRNAHDDSWDVLLAIGAVEQSDVATGDEAHVVARASHEGVDVPPGLGHDWQEDVYIPRVVSIA